MHYNKEYFEWQKNVGALGGVLNRFKFEAYIAGLDTVIDFGWGGYLLRNLNCKRKIGVEINSVARQYAKEKNGIEVFENVDLYSLTK